MYIFKHNLTNAIDFFSIKTKLLKFLTLNKRENIDLLKHTLKNSYFIEYLFKEFVRILVLFNFKKK